MNWASVLRSQIGYRARKYAEKYGIPYYLSLGSTPTAMFEPYDGNTQHGNFLSSSYKAILEQRNWTSRLKKLHQRSNALPAEKRSQAKELDSSNSSDALLMNIIGDQTATVHSSRPHFKTEKGD